MKSRKRVEDKNRSKEQEQHKTVTNMVDLSPTISVTTLNGSSLNAPIKRHFQSRSENVIQLHVIQRDSF